MAEVLADPLYEEIPPLSHGAHHEIFARWRATLPQEITGCCNPASIGGFRQDLESHFPDEAAHLWNDWCDFHEAALRDHGATWLAERGFEVAWV